MPSSNPSHSPSPLHSPVPLPPGTAPATAPSIAPVPGLMSLSRTRRISTPSSPLNPNSPAVSSTISTSSRPQSHVRSSSYTPASVPHVGHGGHGHGHGHGHSNSASATHGHPQSPSSTTSTTPGGTTSGSSSSASSTPTLSPRPFPLALANSDYHHPNPDARSRSKSRPRGYTTTSPTPRSPLAHPATSSSSEGNVPSLMGGESLSPASSPGSSSNGFSVFGITMGQGRRVSTASSMSMVQKWQGGLVPVDGNQSPGMNANKWWGASEEEEGRHRGWGGRGAGVGTGNMAVAKTRALTKNDKEEVPEEHTEGWVHTRARVAKAAKSVLGTTGEVVHEVLFLTSDLLEFAPVPGLASAAKVLLGIWDAVQMVDTNRLQCLRLTERCADILLSVCEEVREAGQDVEDELAAPVETLVDSFNAVLTFLQTQSARPFLKRFLQRYEILEKIKELGEDLGKALDRFGLSIQLRILRIVQEGEKRRREEWEEWREEVEGGLGLKLHPGVGGLGLGLQLNAGRNHERLPLPPGMGEEEEEEGGLGASQITVRPTSPSGHMLTTAGHPPSPHTLAPSPSSLRRSQIIPTLHTLHSTQNAQDVQRDAEDLRQLMRRALRAGSDVEMLGIMGVRFGEGRRGEMREAIKSLWREVERVQQGAADEEADEEAAVKPVEESKVKAPVRVMEKLKRSMSTKGRKSIDETSTSRKSSVDGSTGKSTPGTSPTVASSPSLMTPPSTVKSLVRQDGPLRDPLAYDDGLDAPIHDAYHADHTLDLEFLESGIEALTRLSISSSSSDSEELATLALPPWTITRYEVDVDFSRKIGVGWAADVWAGRWRGRGVAVKVLRTSSSTYSHPGSLSGLQVTAFGTEEDDERRRWEERQRAEKEREVFAREVEVWRRLKHENVLEMYGASAIALDPGEPRFFVCRFCEGGCLVAWLKRARRALVDEGELNVVGGGLVAPLSPAEAKALRRKSATPTLSAKSRESWGPSPGTERERGRSVTGGVVGMGMGSPRESSGSRESGKKRSVIPREADLHRFMVEIAQGMEYLHANGVVHGDLKAANVLVDEEMRCVISDFGQSEMKEEAYRMSVSKGRAPHGTLRWQAPELMLGHNRDGEIALTQSMDVYAYAVTCVEILGWGKVPWSGVDDEAVRGSVIKDDARPALPTSQFSTLLLQDLLHVCWHRDPDVRPLFNKIVQDIRAVRSEFQKELHIGSGALSRVASVRSGMMDMRMEELPEAEKMWGWEWDPGHRARPSPDMRPMELPEEEDESEALNDNIHFGNSPGSVATTGTFHTAYEEPFRPLTSPQILPPLPSHEGPHIEDTVSASTSSSESSSTSSSLRVRMPEAVLYTPSTASSSLDDLGLSLTIPEQEPVLSSSALGHGQVSPGYSHGRGHATPRGHGNDEGWAGVYGSPQQLPLQLQDERRDERRYRLLLSHSFHPSLTLPLWDPTPVHLGAVGYLSKPTGRFVTLFNSLYPEKSMHGPVRALPSLYGYGKVIQGRQRQDKRNAAQRGLDAVVGLLTFKSRGGTFSQSVSRRYSFPLRAGHKNAHMCTETTMYRYMESLDVPKKWFKANVDVIMKIFGPSHHIQKEDLFLVIGTLDTPDYALFVSHNHPDGQAHFNVFSSSKSGQPWGTFTTDTEVPSDLGPSYDEPVHDAPLSASKVSTTGPSWDTVLVARLRFKPDILEPTSL